MARKDIQRVRYTGYDFGSALDDLRASALAEFGIGFSASQSDPGNTLLRYFSFGLDALFFYLDQRAAENFSETARLRSSVARITRQLGYKMRSAVPASTELNITLAQTYLFTVTIPQGFQFVTAAGLIFEASEAVDILPGETTAAVPVYEGETVTERFVSNGQPFQTFALRRIPTGKYGINGTVTCTVDGVPYPEVEFLQFGDTPQVESRFEDATPNVTFGDGIVGSIPPNGAEIVVTYVVCSGLAGNIADGLITDPRVPLVVSLTNIRFLTITNPEGATGGDDPEPLERAKAFAGKVAAARHVAVTGPDYEALSNSYVEPTAGRVAVAKAVAARDVGEDATLNNYLADIQALFVPPAASVAVDIPALQSTLSALLTDLAAITTSLTAIGTRTTNINTASTGNISSLRGAKNKTLDAETDAQDIRDISQDAKLDIDSITIASTSQLTLDKANTLKSYHDRVIAEAQQVTNATTEIRTTIDTVVSLLSQGQSLLTEIGLTLTTPASQLLAAQTSVTTAIARIGTADPPTAAFLNLDNLETAVVDSQADVAEIALQIKNHIARYVVSDCKANLVTVSILAKDSGGFYAPPSNALMRALQSYLTARKAVEQVVSVTSGEQALVRAVISITAKIAPGDGAESRTRAAIQLLTDAALKDRPFGESLYLDRLYQALAGIERRFLNITINGYLDPLTNVLTTDKLDSLGNLIIKTTEVITKGTLSITVEATT